MFARIRTAFEWVCYTLGRIFIIVMESSIPGGNVNQALSNWDRRKSRSAIEESHMNEILSEKKVIKNNLA